MHFLSVTNIGAAFLSSHVVDIFFVAREQGSHETLAIKIVILGLHVIFCKDSIEHKLTEVSYLSYG